MKESEKWNKPTKIGVALFTDLTLFYDAINIGLKKGYLTAHLFKELIEEDETIFYRVKGLKYIKDYKKTAFEHLIQELYLFNFVQKKGQRYVVTEEGKTLMKLYLQNSNEYYLLLLRKMQEVYTIPGWLIDRLWELNPKGQGQIVIPAPIKSWKPCSLRWEDKEWNDNLGNICEKTIEKIHENLAGSFPIDKKEWVIEVKKVYEHQGEQRNTQKNAKSNKNNLQMFSPRKRLTLAMKKATIDLLFNSKDNHFGSSREPLNSRSFMVWCPRLETLGLLFYSDYYSSIPGRLLFPTCVYREVSEKTNFEALSDIQHPNEKFLHLFKPTWESFKTLYLENLHEVYQRIYNREGIIYVSLQDIRDEVCRLLRINSNTFEDFLEKSYYASIHREIHLAISLETDIREDQKGGSQMLRRGIFIRKVMYSLIAITIFQNK